MIFVRLNINEYPDIAYKYDIKGAPTYKFFRKHLDKPENFYVVHYGGRFGNTILKLLKTKMNNDGKGIHRLKELPPFKNHVMKLNGNNYYEFIRQDIYKLIYIYMPWSDRDVSFIQNLFFKKRHTQT